MKIIFDGQGNQTTVQRLYLSLEHIEAASFFAKSTIDSDRTKTKYFSLATITHSVAFLEGFINELLIDAKEFDGIWGNLGFNEDHRKTLITEFREIERLAVLKKYNKVLDVIARKAINKSTTLYDSASSLIDLRNYLIHAKPEELIIYNTNKIKQYHFSKLERRLKGKFNLSSDAGTYLGSGIYQTDCANWALNTVIDFHIEFTKQLGSRAYDIEHLKVNS
ncbi:hypothetical protein [Alteromonas gracilis]|uniref:hypothetical protein n=1 Tax=Alteromonas gracilis TaxID=1479524 RepID=UPI0037359394